MFAVFLRFLILGKYIELNNFLMKKILSKSVYLFIFYILSSKNINFIRHLITLVIFLASCWSKATSASIWYCGIFFSFLLRILEALVLEILLSDMSKFTWANWRRTRNNFVKDSLIYLKSKFPYQAFSL